MASRTITVVAAALMLLGGCTFYTGGGHGDGFDQDGVLPDVPEAPGEGPDGDDPAADSGDLPVDGGGADLDPADDDLSPQDPAGPDGQDDPLDDSPDDPPWDPASCDPPCGPGETCIEGSCIVASEHEAAQQLCADLTNEYRLEHGRGEVRRSSDLEACATEGAEFDSSAWFPHAHFSRTNGCGGVADAENECPGWSGDVMTVIRDCLAMMMNEGPGGGHYENILGNHTAVGCGIYVTPRGSVWMVQNFK